MSAARNTALDHATGRYVTFVDSDDFIAPQYVEVLCQLIQESRAQAALCGWHLYPDGDAVPKPDDGSHSHTYTAAEAVNHIFYQRKGLTQSVCARLYDASVFRDVRFPVGMLYEDLAVLMPVMQNSQTVVFTPQRLYYYRQRQGSIITTFNSHRAHILDILEDLERRAPQRLLQYAPLGTAAR